MTLAEKEEAEASKGAILNKATIKEHIKKENSTNLVL